MNRTRNRCEEILRANRRFSHMDLMDDCLDEQDRLFVYNPPRREISSLPRVEPANYTDFFWLLAAIGSLGVLVAAVGLGTICWNWIW